MNKEKILKIILVVVYTLFIALFIAMRSGIWIFKDNVSYRITKIGCNSSKNSTKDLTEEGECTTPGYYIDDDRVNISLGSINCANDIKIVKVEADKDMNVTIKVKEKKGRVQAKCVCSPSLNIEFNKEVNSVTLIKEDGTELGECYDN